MDFNFTDDQIKLRKEVQEFVAEEIIPVIADFDAKDEFPMEIARKAFDKKFIKKIYYDFNPIFVSASSIISLY
jgi:alkylation response protein AidB-like acyl-CoA dehydrogenase